MLGAGICVAVVSVAVSMRAHAGEVLSWNGYERDPHPRLYVTTADVERARQTRKDIAALAAMAPMHPQARFILPVGYCKACLQQMDSA